jgi:hypothetical protein
VVLETGHGFKVRPAVTQVNGQLNPFFRIKNNTKHLVSVIMPSAIVDPGDVYTDIPAGESEEITLHGGGTFTYVVLVHTLGGPVAAQGESDPVIIIDPPTP